MYELHYARCWAKHFTQHPHEVGTVVIPTLHIKKQGPRESNVPQITWLNNDRARARAQAVYFQSPACQPLPYTSLPR